MILAPEHIAYRKKVGHIGDDAVIELATTGGLHMHVRIKKNGGTEVLSCGPHRAVARHIAQKREAGIVWSDLNKSDWLDQATIDQLVPQYETETLQFRRASGFKD